MPAASILSSKGLSEFNYKRFPRLKYTKTGKKTRFSWFLTIRYTAKGDKHG